MLKRLSFAAVILLFVGVTDSFAHHAVQSEFDVTKFTVLRATLTKVEWLNPHSYMHFDVLGEDKSVQHWNIETGAPIALRRAGIASRDVFKIGETYVLQVHPARDGSFTGLMNEVTLPDGTKVQIGSQESISGGEQK